MNGIPAFIVLSNEGDLISEQGREDILDHGEKALEIWEKTLKENLDN